jgi:hypothetical protein
MPKQNQPRHSAYCTRVPYLQCGTLRPTHPGTPCCIRPDVQWWNGTVQCIDLTLTPAAALSPHACAAVPCRRVYGRVAETWQGNLVVQGIKNLADAVSNKVGSVFLEKPATSTSVPSMGVHLCIMAPTLLPRHQHVCCHLPHASLTSPYVPLVWHADLSSRLLVLPGQCIITFAPCKPSCHHTYLCQT